VFRTWLYSAERGRTGADMARGPRDGWSLAFPFLSQVCHFMSGRYFFGVETSPEKTPWSLRGFFHWKLGTSSLRTGLFFPQLRFSFGQGPAGSSPFFIPQVTCISILTRVRVNVRSGQRPFLGDHRHMKSEVLKGPHVPPSTLAQAESRNPGARNPPLAPLELAYSVPDVRRPYMSQLSNSFN